MIDQPDSVSLKYIIFLLGRSDKVMDMGKQ